MIDAPSLAIQLGGHPSVAISGKFQTDRLDPSLDHLLQVLLRGSFLLGDVIKAARRKNHEFTPSLEVFKPGEVIEKELSLLSAFSRVFLRAFFKRSFSGVGWPTNRSSFSMRSARAASRLGSLPNFPRHIVFSSDTGGRRRYYNAGKSELGWRIRLEVPI